MREEALDWLEEARADLRRARQMLEEGDYAISCFFSHQAVEKALKAIMIGLARKRPPRTHDLTVLYSEVEGFLELPEETFPQLQQDAGREGAGGGSACRGARWRSSRCRIRSERP